MNKINHKEKDLSLLFKTTNQKRIKEKYNISINTQKFILQMLWAQHDGQWYLKTKKELGYKIANDLNNKTLYSMGKIEARYILDALNIEKGSINTIPEILKIMNTIMDVCFPKIMKFNFFVNSDKEGVGIVKKCFIWDMVKKSKGEAEYTCACNFRHHGWLKGFGVDAEIIPVNRISEGNDVCEFKFILKTK